MKEVMTVKEVSEYLRCSESCIWKLKRELQIPFFRVGKKVLFDKEKINNWIEINISDSLEKNEERRKENEVV